MGKKDVQTLDLFHGPHIARFRYQRALEALDLEAALPDAPAEWRRAVERLCEAARVKRPRKAAVEALVGAHHPGWPEELQRVWCRLLGRRLDSGAVPGVVQGRLAADFLLEAGDILEARASLRRHLKAHPRDIAGWRSWAKLEPEEGAARCAFHGGPILPAAEEIESLVEQDEIEPIAPWLLTYAWFSGKASLELLEDALSAEGLLEQAPFPIQNDGRAFAYFLYAAEISRRRGQGLPPGVVDPRRQMQKVSKAAFKRYLARVG